METIEVLFLCIGVFEAFALASLPTVQSECDRRIGRPKHFSA